jgi:hypothetical protein
MEFKESGIFSGVHVIRATGGKQAWPGLRVKPIGLVGFRLIDRVRGERFKKFTIQLIFR